MNREIKYRIFDKSLRVYINPEFTGFINSIFVCDEDYLFQEYTGIKDIHGVDIYEGDIVRYKVWEGGTYYEDFEIYEQEVIYEDGSFSPIPTETKCIDSYYNERYYDFEVVGNINERK